jgi:chromosome segregation ATPase
LERERVERGDLLHRLEETEREVLGWLERQSGVDDAARRYQEGVAHLNLRIEGFEGRLEATEGKVSRSLEAVTRADQEIDRIEATLLDLGREDGVQAERSRVALEAARRLEGEVSADRRNLDALNQTAEHVELLRAERQRLDDRVAGMEEALEELRNLLRNHEQLIAVLDGRTQGYQGHLDSQREELGRYRQQILDHLRKLSTGQERLKRHQITDLEREIQELRKHAIELAED